MTDQRYWFSVWIEKQGFLAKETGCVNGFNGNGMWCPLEEFDLRSHQSTWQCRLKGCLGTLLWGVVPECSATHGNLNSTTRPCRSHIHFFAVVQNSLQNCSVCHVMEIVDDKLIVLIRFEYICCQQGTLLIGERKGLIVSTFFLGPVTELSLL